MSHLKHQLGTGRKAPKTGKTGIADFKAKVISYSPVDGFKLHLHAGNTSLDIGLDPLSAQFMIDRYTVAKENQALGCILYFIGFNIFKREEATNEERDTD